MQLINATPHALTIISNKGVILDEKKKTYSAKAEDIEVLFTLEVSGLLPRVSCTEEEGEPICGIPTVTVIWGEVEGLPPEQEGIAYVVSSLTAEAAKKQGRKDCFAPSKLVRDASNGSNVLGCLKLGR